MREKTKVVRLPKLRTPEMEYALRTLDRRYFPRDEKFEDWDIGVTFVTIRLIDKGIIGFIHMTDDGFIDRVAVMSAYRRRGIGKRLIRACLRFAFRKGLSRVHTYVSRGNQPSLLLFMLAGFHVPHPYKRPHKQWVIFERTADMEGV